jgi:hypothetical protein
MGAGPSAEHLHSESRTLHRIDVRYIRKVTKASTSSFEFKRTSLDSHADTCCAGSNMAVLELKEEKVNVFPFSDSYAALQTVPIATICMVWESPKMGELWMLVFHVALYFGAQLKESLVLCPNQMRAAGITMMMRRFSSTRPPRIPSRSKVHLRSH